MIYAHSGGFVCRAYMTGHFTIMDGIYFPYNEIFPFLPLEVGTTSRVGASGFGTKVSLWPPRSFFVHTPDLRQFDHGIFYFQAKEDNIHSSHLDKFIVFEMS